MQITRTLGMTGVAAIVLCAAGCHCAPKVPPPPPASPPVVDVGGVVDHPQTVPVPPEGLTLLQGIIRAGGLNRNYTRSARPESASEKEIKELLVSVRRGADIYYIPLRMVETDLPGNVQLVPGDVVQIIPATESGLYLQPATVTGDHVVIDGIHPLNGAFSMSDIKSVVQKGDNLLLQDLWEKDPFVAGRDGLSAPAVVLTRPNASSNLLKEHYVLPTDFYVDRQAMLTGTLSVAALRAGDELNFTTIESIPIVAAGILAPIIRNEFLRQDALNSAELRAQCRGLFGQSPPLLPGR